MSGFGARGLGVALTAMLASAPAFAQTMRFDLSAQDAAVAVPELARQAGVQIMISGRDAAGRHLNPVRGNMTVVEALDRLLTNSGLTARPVGSNAFVVTALKEVVSEDAAPNEGDIVVTATRRPERLSKVPVAVSVVSGDRLRDTNLNTLRDVTSIVPSLNFRNAASAKDQAFFIRGLGTVSTSTAVEPSVSTVIDGVVLARQGQAVLDLIDIDRIEVLRGPQGTLFGKNASAGVINIVSRNPSTELTGYLDGFYGTRGDEKRIRGSISGPILADKLGFLVNLLYGDYDGNVRNVYTNRDINGYNRKGAKAKLRFTPSENVDLLLSADYVHSKETTPTGVVTRTYRVAYPTNVITQFPLFAADLLPVVASQNNTLVNSDFESRAIDRNGGLSLEGNIGAGTHTITSITAYRWYDNTQFQDQDRASQVVTGVPQSHDIGHLRSHQFSQELRLTSPATGVLTYVAGLYYFKWADDEDYRRDTLMVSGATKVANFGVANWHIGNENYSAFGELTLHFTPQFRALAGARVVHDDLNYDFTRVSSSPNVAVPSIQVNFASNGDTKRTGYADRLGLEHDLARFGMAYFTYSRGYKGPAYNVPFSMLPQDTQALNPETNNTFEIGLKAHTLDGRAALNVAAFHSKFNNYQVNFVDLYNGSQVTRLINAGAVSTRGIEGDFSARPINGLSLTAAAAYIKARVDHFTCPVGAAVSCNIDGGPLPFSPKWKANGRAAYTITLGSALGLELSTDYDWRSKVQFSINQTPDTIQDAYGIWNAGIALTGFRGFRLSAIVKNIANRHYATTLTTFGTGVVRYVPRDDSRYFGFGVRKEF